MGLPPAAAWVSGDPSRPARPHGSLAGWSVRGKFAAHRGKFDIFFECALLRACRLGCFPSRSRGPPETGFSRDKKQNIPWGWQVVE